MSVFPPGRDGVLMWTVLEAGLISMVILWGPPDGVLISRALEERLTSTVFPLSALEPVLTSGLEVMLMALVSPLGLVRHLGWFATISLPFELLLPHLNLIRLIMFLTLS